MRRAEKRRLDELRVEVGVEESFKKKLVRSRLKWVGYVERMGDKKLAKRADAQKVGGKWRRGKEGFKRDLDRVGDWRKRYKLETVDNNNNKTLF